MNIVIFGPPGVGKGTQSKLLVERFKMRHISTGDAFRRHMSEGTKIGKTIQSRMDKGFLIDDELTFQLLKDELQNQTDNILLDGYPRTLPQASDLEKLLHIDYVIVLSADEEILKQRIAKRKLTKPRSDDDKIEQRMSEYYQKTVATLQHYKAPVLVEFDASRNAEEVFSQICDTIS